MNQARFNSSLNGMSSIGKKVFNVIPADTYWSLSRSQNELFRAGINKEAGVIAGVVNSLVNVGLVIAHHDDMFSKVKVNQHQENQPLNIDAYYEKPKMAKQSKEKEMAPKEKQNPFDAVREVAIKFLDVAKTINALASEIDLKLSDVEKHMAANDQDTAKLKQLQVLLKSLG